MNQVMTIANDLMAEQAWIPAADLYLFISTNSKDKKIFFFITTEVNCLGIKGTIHVPGSRPFLEIQVTIVAEEQGASLTEATH